MQILYCFVYLFLIYIFLKKKNYNNDYYDSQKR